jgi:putative ABC transport system permease protein
MRLKSTIKNSLKSLKSNRTRSALTILGIVIGISAVIIMVSIGNGAQGLILNEISSMGSNNIFVEPGPPHSGDAMQAMMEEFEIKTLKFKDLEDILKTPNVVNAAPLVIGVERIVYGDKNKKVTFYGTSNDFFSIMNGDFDIGQGFTNGNVKSMEREIVLGYKIKKDLFGDENPLGLTVRIKKTNFRVVGVLAEKGTQMFMNLDEYVYLPVATVQKLLLGIDHFRNIVVQSSGEEKTDQIIYDIRLLLRQNHNINNPTNDFSKDDFKVTSQKEAANMVSQVTSIFTLFLSSVAAIALLVGGIGIMNIMLVSVTERTKEIGLRKAVGAKPKDILYQFLSESVILTMFGGLVGIFIGVTFSILTGFVLSKVLNLNWGLNISLPAILLGFSVATIIGLVFGIYPAQKASKLDPIEALRYE